MTPRRKMLPEIQLLVRQRAGYSCEYCHTLEVWQYVQLMVDHVSRSREGVRMSLEISPWHVFTVTAGKLTN